MIQPDPTHECLEGLGLAGMLIVESVTLTRDPAGDPETAEQTETAAQLPLLVRGTITATYEEEGQTYETRTDVYVCTNNRCDPKKTMIVYGPDGEYWFIDMSTKNQWSFASMESGPAEVGVLAHHGTVVSWVEPPAPRGVPSYFVTCFVLNMKALSQTIPAAHSGPDGD
ncbi:hypothetical protein [Chondromyces crocatus]|uniref:hypothetical protein n=1 Tax=Chondromyces crocatus TaxID=52 RepID=UPI0012E10CEA|nr:hypothetical protein [Chondromyces crocatus]